MPLPGRALELAGALDVDRKWYLRLMRENARLAAAPGPLKAIDTAAQLRELPLVCVGTRMILPALGATAETSRRHDAQMRNAATAAAVKRFQLANGRLPERLDELVPRFLEAPPIDPCDGQPLRYKLTNRGAIGGGHDRSSGRRPHCRDSACCGPTRRSAPAPPIAICSST